MRIVLLPGFYLFSSSHSHEDKENFIFEYKYHISSHKLIIGIFSHKISITKAKAISNKGTHYLLFDVFALSSINVKKINILSSFDGISNSLYNSKRIVKITTLFQ